MYIYFDNVFEFDEEDPDIWLLHQVCLPPSFSSAVAISFFLSLFIYGKFEYDEEDSQTWLLQQVCVCVCLSLSLSLSVCVCLWRD